MFERYVNSSAPIEDMRRAAQQLPKNSSSRNLLEAAAFARTWIESFCNQRSSGTIEQARILFALASYLEKRVQVVCVDVTSEIDAFVLFEALNDRGLELSALDLVKNHIYSRISSANEDAIRYSWESMSSKIEGQDADDFLKVFWTSRFGIVQKANLFPRIRGEYANEAGAETLAMELADAAEKLERIDDYEHPAWNNFSPCARDYLKQLNLIGSKQVRPAILSAMSRLADKEFEPFLATLVVLLVRYQIIGRLRTGVLEKHMGSLAQKLWDRTISSANAAWTHLLPIIPNDEDFSASFSRHIERKGSRLAYLFSGLEHAYVNAPNISSSELGCFGDRLSSAVVIDWILPPTAPTAQTVSGEIENTDRLLGNVVLLEEALYKQARGLSPSEKSSQIYSHSSLNLTREVSARWPVWNTDTIKDRTNVLAKLAVLAWPLAKGK